MADAPSIDPAQKWATLRKIDPECWEQVGTGGQGSPIWELKPDWLRVMFKGAFVNVRAVAPPGLQPLQAVSFAHRDGTYDLRIYSRLRAGKFCDTSWQFGAPPGAELPPHIGHLGRRRLEVPLVGAEGFTAPVNVIWLVDPALPQGVHIRYFCPAIDETIDIDAVTLDLGYVENAMEKSMKVYPWQKYAFWLRELKSIDRHAFSRIPGKIRSWLQSQDGQRFSAQTNEQEIGHLIQQGMLPPWLAWLMPQEVPQVMKSLRDAQNVARRPEVIQQFAMQLQMPGFNPVPKLITAVDANRLDPADLQVFMTIGALREIHGYAEVAQAELIKRRPDLLAARQSPNGNKILAADPDIMAINSDPRVQAEQQEMLAVQFRQQGQFGPTMAEITSAMQIITNIQQQQIAGQLFGAGLWTMMLGMDAPNQYLTAALANGPPWKLYKPYCC
ncbi:hypothetical protein [Sphingomonas sp. SUN039]|uniref:hypothetical protein n=1 Tax=Sphingomonas sp. SUN039 TaxID=2937787 RepID=UPI0021645F67|nr:hypothetical protein [Sphingomonas sp. SUN039]UVO53761.1 hypothetical protein M0209_06350 [Sphingomonas sp. SUN039]